MVIWCHLQGRVIRISQWVQRVEHYPTGTLSASSCLSRSRSQLSCHQLLRGHDSSRKKRPDQVHCRKPRLIFESSSCVREHIYLVSTMRAVSKQDLERSKKASQFIRIASSRLKATVRYHAGKYQTPYATLSKLIIEICIHERAWWRDQRGLY